MSSKSYVIYQTMTLPLTLNDIEYTNRSPNYPYFYRASYAKRGLGSCNSVRPSVRLSVCLSVTRVLCD